MPKKPTNAPVAVSAALETKEEFIKQTALHLLLTLVSTNGKLHMDQPRNAVEIATELAKLLKL